MAKYDWSNHLSIKLPAKGQLSAEDFLPGSIKTHLIIKALWSSIRLTFWL